MTITMKDLRDATEGVPDNAEVRFLSDGENPLEFCVDLTNVFLMNEPVSNQVRVILTDDDLSKF